MNIKELSESVKEKINSLYEKILEFFSENKVLAVTISALLCVILICIILLIATSGSNKKKVQPLEEITLSESVINPDGPALPKDYNLSRITNKNWDESEISQWFTIPSQKDIDSLSKANENMVNEIIGAAP